MKYTTTWLIDQYENGVPLKYIYFWGNTGKYNEAIGKHCFSQWFEAPFIVAGIEYKTAEHYMMAQKAKLFGDMEAFSKIVACIKPAEAKELGREVRNYNEEVWDTHKYYIVKTGNIHKFNQNPLLAEFLLATANRIIVEASPVDTIWGIGLSQDSEHINNLYMWRGSNLLGFALMETRDFFSEIGHFENPELIPPWNQYIGIGPYDLFWRMGKGEDALTEFSKAYNAFSEKDKIIYQLTYPLPPDWYGFYENE